MGDRLMITMSAMRSLSLALMVREVAASTVDPAAASSISSMMYMFLGVAMLGGGILFAKLKSKMAVTADGKTPPAAKASAAPAGEPAKAKKPAKEKKPKK